MSQVYKFVVLLMVVALFVLAPAALAQEGQMDENTFEVNLQSDRIDVPENLPAGRVTFAVTNQDTVEREFQLAGAGLQEGFGATLQPGETQNIAVDLQAGPYEFFYPGPDYREQGMFTEVTVLDIDAYDALLVTETAEETDVDTTVTATDDELTKGAEQDVLLPETGGIASPMPSFLLLAAGAGLVLIGLAGFAFSRRS